MNKIAKNGQQTKPLKEESPRLDSILTILPQMVKNGIGIVSAADRVEHAMDMAIIAAGWQTLRRIRDRKSYRDEYPTFEKFVEALWDYGRTYAYRLICAAEIFSELSKVSKILPQNEAQVRPLLTVPAGKLQEVWQRVEKEAQQSSLTADMIKKAAEPFQAKAAAKTGPRRKPLAQLSSQIFKLLDDLRYFIRESEAEKALATVEKVRLTMLGS